MGVRDVGLVAVGGAVGAVARVALASWFPVADSGFPWTTFAQNVAGAFLLAFLLTLLAARWPQDRKVRLLVGTGLLGAFTTYSTFTVEIADLLTGGFAATGVAYGVSAVVAGVTAAFAGLRLARALGA